ncbi:DUF262 domain-containing protein [Clostridium sp.]|uniref:DUF262 domain-containing protein n=1 Tax=Clostridium sp. TaxID=1506 RepID=UPI002914FD9A|nr:DUF262 domain-containing protein [Clostridium sp.]MDU6542916.1 DUF262 domain-containing protein [Clostridium sp.]
MKVNKSLMTASAFNPTKKTHQMTILDMCQKIETKEISLPLYQRDISWTISKCIDLLNYQLLGKAPVAPISINLINNADDYVPQVSFIDREIIDEVKRGQFSVVDGQQRLTTNFKAYEDSNDFRSIVLDLIRGKFILESEAIKKHQIPVGKLLNKEDPVFYEYIMKSDILSKPEVMPILVQCRSKIRNYSYTINQAEDLIEDEQIEWFEVLNNAGSRVSILQMRFSKLKAHGIDIYVQYTSKFKNKLEDLGYNYFTPQKTGVSYPIAALNSAYEIITDKPHTEGYTPIPSDTKENQLCNLDPVQLKQCFEMTLEALDKAVNFISDNNLMVPDRIDYINYLTGYFVYNGNSIDEDKKEKLINWYNSVNFANKSNSKRREEFTNLINI